MNSGQAKARQSMHWEVMDCRGAMHLSMNRLVIANAVKQSMTSEGMDRHGLRPRDDANNTVIARNVVTWQSICGIGPDSGGSP
jgi:hypothetical protein